MCVCMSEDTNSKQGSTYKFTNMNFSSILSKKGKHPSSEIAGALIRTN